MGGAVAAIEAGFMQEEIEQAAFGYAKAVDDRREGHRRGQQVRRRRCRSPRRCSRSTRRCERHQIERVRRTRAERDQPAVDAALADVAAAARGTQNLLPPMKEALRRRATLGEVSDVLRGVFGVYQPTR